MFRADVRKMILGGVLKGARSRSSLRADGIPRAGLLLLYAYPTFDYWPDTAASPLRTCATELWPELNKMAFWGSCCGFPGWRLRSTSYKIISCRST